MLNHLTVLSLGAALLLGIVAGMRSMMPLAAVSLALWRLPILRHTSAPASWLAHPVVASVLVLAALGELVGDKLPMTPNRTALAPFVGRLITGALSGAAAAQIGNITGWAGAVCGVIGAGTSTLGMFHARRAFGRATWIRDPFVGAMEDVLALGVSVIAVWLLAQA